MKKSGPWTASNIRRAPGETGKPKNVWSQCQFTQQGPVVWSTLCDVGDGSKPAN